MEKRIEVKLSPKPVLLTEIQDAATKWLGIQAPIQPHLFLALRDLGLVTSPHRASVSLFVK